MAHKQAEPTIELQEEDTPENKICISKLKINRPKILFNFFQKENFGGWTLERKGLGVMKKRPKDALHEKNGFEKSSLYIQKYCKLLTTHTIWISSKCRDFSD